jgi:hypothetical protein
MPGISTDHDDICDHIKRQCVNCLICGKVAVPINNGHSLRCADYEHDFMFLRGLYQVSTVVHGQRFTYFFVPGEGAKLTIELSGGETITEPCDSFDAFKDKLAITIKSLMFV